MSASNRLFKQILASLLVVSSALLAGFSPIAAAAPAPADPPAATGDVDVDQALIDRLDSTRVDVAYQPEDLVKIIDQLRVQHGLNVQVAWGVLDQAGVRKDRRIEMRLSDVPLSAVLDNLIREIDSDGVADLGWGVERGIVVITSKSALGRSTTLRVYDVRDLLESGYAFRRFLNTPVLGLRTTGREQIGGEPIREKAGGGGMGGGGGGGGIFGSPGDDPAQLSRMERIDQIVSLIQENVVPESWRDNGGDTGSISERDGVLLIEQTPQSHRRIARLLSLIRSTRPSQLQVDVAVVRLAPQRAAEIRNAIGEGFPGMPGSQAASLAFGAATDGVLFRASSGAASGSAAWFSDVGQTDAIESIDALVAQQASALLPRLGALHDGLELIVLPLLVPSAAGDRGSETVQLDVQMAIKPPVEVMPGVIGAAPAGEKGAERSATVAATPDRSRERMRTVSSSATLSLGDAVILSIPERPDASGRSIQHEEWLVVRVRRAESK